MRRIILLLLSAVVLAGTASAKKRPQVETWPDGTVIDVWFRDTAKVDPASLGRQYVITDYGVIRDSATGLAFINLAQAVVTVVNRRNKEQPKTKIVGQE